MIWKYFICLYDSTKTQKKNETSVSSICIYFSRCSAPCYCCISTRWFSIRSLPYYAQPFDLRLLCFYISTRRLIFRHLSYITRSIGMTGLSVYITRWISSSICTYISTRWYIIRSLLYYAQPPVYAVDLSLYIAQFPMEIDLFLYITWSFLQDQSARVYRSDFVLNIWFVFTVQALI